MKKVLFLIAVCIVTIMVPFSVFAEAPATYSVDNTEASLSVPRTNSVLVASGACGNQAKWEVYVVDNHYELVITGTGAMIDYNDNSILPWSRYYDDITTIIVKNGITKIGRYAFHFLGNVTTIILPASLTSIGEDAFWPSDNITLHVDNVDMLLSLSNMPNEKRINKAILHISGERATELTVPEGYTTIRDYCFSNFSNITKITLPEGIKSIGIDAFYNCTGLQEINIPSTVKAIGKEAFYKCKSLSNLALPSALESIGTSTFSNCTSISSISIPKVTEIPEKAFYNCSSLNSISFGNNLKSIGNGAFTLCSNLDRIELPNGLESLGANAFSACSNAESVHIPSSLLSVGSAAFEECDSLHKVYIDDLAAYLVIDYPNISYSAHPTYNVADLYINGTLAIDITIPSEITELKEKVFYNCTSIKRVTVPEGVTSIEEHVFASCTNLETVIIPKSLVSFNKYAFTRAERVDVYYPCDWIPDFIGTEFVNCTVKWYPWHDSENIHHEGITPTCINEGDLETWYCDICKKYYSDSSRTKEVSQSDFVIPKTDHAFNEWRIAKEVTCTEDGTKEKICIVCGNKVTESIPATGHIYGDWKVTKEATCTEDGSKERVCDVCGDKVTEVIAATGHTPSDPVKENEVEATCDKDGSFDQVIFCSVCKEELSRETKAVDSLGHNWNEPVYTWSDDYSSVTATKTCKNDINNNHVISETVKTTSEVTKPATYTTKGETTYTAVFTNKAFYTQTKTVANIDKLQPEEATPTPSEGSNVAPTPKDTEPTVEESATVSARTVKVTSTEGKTVSFTAAKNVKSVVVPDTVTIEGAQYKVTQIDANAFKGSKIRTVTIGKNVKVVKKNAFKGSSTTKLIVKTKLLKKAKVKGCLKGSKIKTVQVKIGNKATNKKYVKTYKKIFTKANAGKKVIVK